jgi:flagellar biosynthesis GTPase FlhF
MEVMKTQSSDARMRTALGSLNSDTKTGLESFKVNGVAYQEFQVEDPGSKGRMLPRVGNDIPSQPAYTSWSGLMRCSPNSRYAARLMEKCGGVAIGVDESEFTEADAKKADAKKADAKKAAEEKAAKEKADAKKAAEEKAAEEKAAEEKAAEEKAADKPAQQEKVMSEAEKLEAKKEKARWWRSAHKVIGYWTAPEDWREMLEGNESPALCSTKDYPKQSFQPSWT